ncbi:hypothetical protein EPR50_G00200110 [Perca flavescens]|uniref:NWD1/2-like winged helix-turn-helix domain-containing protein n=1 Tax=Perca flavescens TaxID=8167 RepID=A0A484CE65_PERFV|nr:hypothetical protein EPR50_G00200110 [Perca flavescens]
MENVYPRLYLYCKQRGYDFSMVDLRLGVGSPVAERHNTVELHVENLQRCQETQGPNFILFVGQKNEVQSLPSTITREAFEAIVRVVEKDQQQASKYKPVEDFPASGSQSSITTDSSSGSFVQDSIYGNYLIFGEQAKVSGLLSQSSCNSFSKGEEARLSPVGARSPGDLDKDLTLLQMCYRLDRNCLAPVYRLLPISSHHSDMLSMEMERRKQAMKDWSATCRRLWAILQRSADEAVGQEEASILLRTVLDWEVETALQSVKDAPPEEHCHCYKRLIPDLYNNLKHKHAAQYTDLQEGRAQLDPVLSTAHQQFIDRLHEKGLYQLINEFHSLLGLVGAERPLMVLLDGLDELSEEHGADLSWISTPLPPNVYLILSATTDSHCTHTLQSAHPTVLSLPPLSPDDITAALETKLQTDQRCLQEQQWQLLIQACLSCPCPLYLEAAYSESMLWTSYSPQASISLPASLGGLYLAVLARLERELGRQLVRRAASLISISRWGVTEEELLDLLAQDGKVLQEVTSCHSSSGHPRVPYVLWARLKRDLGHHLTEVRTDGTWVYRWTHSELRRVCMKHYLKTDDSLMAVHADYANYYRHKSQHTHIFQPLAWTLDEDGEGMSKSYRFNLRKLHGLPHHLVRSSQILLFLSECLFNYEFLLHKAWGLSVLDIEEDLKKAVLPDKELVDVKVLSGALEMSRAVLLQDPCQLASQLMGRLGQIVIEDRPLAKGDPLKFSYLHALLSQCRQSSLSVLLPSSTCLLPPGDLQHILLAGHLTNVTALGEGKRGPLAVTSESDGRLRFWDLEQRRIIRSLDAVGGIVGDSITLGLDDRMLIVRMGQSLQVFDLASSCSLLHCADISMEHEAIHKNRSILLSNNSIRDYVLFAYRSCDEAAVFSARGGAVLSVLSVQHGAASIQAVDMTEDYLLLFCRFPYKRGSEIIQIKLFSTVSFLYLRSILGCSQDCISQVTVNRAGTHVVAFCPSPCTGITELVTWNLETEDHKHITRCPAVLTKGLCFDLRFCLGVCSGEKYLRLWDLTSRIRDRALTYNIYKLRSEGTEEVVPMGKTQRYAVCRSIRAGTVYVWNLTRRRFACRPVRAEHGLYSSTDVVLAHDFKLYIFTDRSRNSSVDAASCPFQTLLVYDLIKRSYVRRQTGITVYSCPQHEYRVLGNGRTLLGLSETRDRLILWDLDSGSIKHEIKLSHRESLLCSCPVQDLQPNVTPRREKTLMPWDIRTESQSAKKRRLEREAQREREAKSRLEREKYNLIDQYLLSGDEQVVVCSYFAHHLNVFSVVSQEHLHSLGEKTSLLSLHTAAITYTGSHLVLTSYNHEHRTPHITLWDLHTGAVRKRLRNEAGVCCVDITDNAERVVFGVRGSNKLKVWDPFKRIYRSICGYGNLMIEYSSKLHVTEGGTRAILLSGQLSLWDLEAGSVLSVLSLDAHVRCMKLLLGCQTSVLLGLSHSPALISVRLTSSTVSSATQVSQHGDLFGESSSSEEEDGNS